MKRSIFSILGLPVLLAMMAMPMTQANAGVLVNIDFQNGGVVGAAFDTGTVVGTTVSAAVNPALAPGLILSAVGTATDATAVLNATASNGLGINSAGADDSDGVETALGESLSFTFNQDVTLINVEFANFDNNAGSTDSASFGGFTIVGPAATGSDVFAFPAGTVVTAGTPIIFEENVGNGVSLEFLNIEVEVAVPEPSSAALLALGLSGFGLVRRRK